MFQPTKNKTEILEIIKSSHPSVEEVILPSQYSILNSVINDSEQNRRLQRYATLSSKVDRMKNASIAISVQIFIGSIIRISLIEHSKNEKNVYIAALAGIFAITICGSLYMNKVLKEKVAEDPEEAVKLAYNILSELQDQPQSKESYSRYIKDECSYIQHRFNI